jgi:hypothetical protein
MPIRKRGNCYRYGNQKRYCGPGAKRKAIRQMKAIKSSQARRR